MSNRNADLLSNQELAILLLLEGVWATFVLVVLIGAGWFFTGDKTYTGTDLTFQLDDRHDMLLVSPWQEIEIVSEHDFFLDNPDAITPGTQTGVGAKIDYNEKCPDIGWLASYKPACYLSKPKLISAGRWKLYWGDNVTIHLTAGKPITALIVTHTDHKLIIYIALLIITVVVWIFGALLIIGLTPIHR